MDGAQTRARTRPVVRIDAHARTADMLVAPDKIERRRTGVAGIVDHVTPLSQTPRQEIQRDMVGQFDTGAVPEPAVKYRRIAQKGLPRDSH